MNISISDLKSHVETYVGKVGLMIGGAEHAIVKRFVDFVQGKQAEVDAVSYLTAKGYTVTPPVPPPVQDTPVPPAA